MRVSVIAAAVVLAFATPALAQTADADRASQMELADRYLRITMGEDLDKFLSSYFEESYRDTDLTSEQRTWLTNHMVTAYSGVLDATIADLRDDVAQDFTREELEAAIAFYESPLGRSIVRKTMDLSVDAEREMMPHLMDAMTSLGKKYCERFDCGASGGQMVKPGR
ncbi:DUF2059 domain-containing protein [Brevundimonas sp. Root1279]|uniref:DUF2059 domain-containing protein n=1 Tax=Brevundimonas sp. Root1279 TaxID=1736443 RepID=UPI0006F876FA|nr:DUF2059 domain-containing protein [Brevundimonas sp. Root1279]KQW79543.1 hypothetical protein ASC65_13315 [Brevundimonas sp. Root1279]